MEFLQFDDLSLFSKIGLDEETLMIHSKCGNYSFYINFKDEIKGVDYYDLAIATKTSNGFINKSGDAKTVKRAVMDTLSGKEVRDDIKRKIDKPKVNSKNNSNTKTKVPFYSNSSKKNRRFK
ncbi:MULTISPECIES: hypothetical protein [unclassified Romboutsia]|uniref:hypothetical protein n=1 Tax=unclassified Romboutsia TaxID=2626894 RepID=UPI0008203640|nr:MULTISPECIES: hypothetical protein [unclassified Romboutsia]SCI26262.1 Uncharacterised protein [uncultured Clostridium sp.]